MQFVKRLFLGFLYLSANPFPSRILAQARPVFDLGLLDKTRRVFSDAIRIVSPLPNYNAMPGIKFEQQIDILEHFQPANPLENIDLSITASNWLTMGLSNLWTINSFDLGGEARDICFFGDYACVALDNAIKIIDIRNGTNLVVVGSWNLTPDSTKGKIFLKGNNTLIYCKESQILALDISNVSDIKLISTYIPYQYKCVTYDIFLFDNILYRGSSYFTSTSGNQDAFEVINVTNPAAMTKKWNTYSGGGGNIIGCSNVYVSDHYVYFCDKSYVDIRDIRTLPGGQGLWPSVAVINLPLVSAALSVGNCTILASGITVAFFDVSQITMPLLKNTVYIGAIATKLVKEGNYLYAFCGSAGIAVINIETIINPKFSGLFPTPGSANTAFFRGNIAFTADGIVGLSLLGTQRVLSGTPPPTVRGLLPINVTAVDDSGNRVIDPITIHLGSIDVKVPIPNQQVYIGNTTLFTIPPDTFEFPNVFFTYSAELVGGLPLPPFIDFDSETATFIFAPKSGDQTVVYRIQVTASDSYTESSSLFDLIVPNRPPVIEEPLMDKTGYSNTLFQYIFSKEFASDLDGDTLTFSANGVPGWLTFDPVLRKFSGTPFGKGVFPIEVIANDGYGGMASDTFTITIPNSAPFLLNAPGTQIASIGIPFTYIVNTNTFFDFDNDPLTYSTGALPQFLNFNPATRTFSGTPQLQDMGTYSITLQVQDSEGAMDSTVFTITVLGSSNNNPPVLVKETPDLTEKAGIPFTYTFDQNTFKDPEGGVLKYDVVLEGGDPLPDGLYFDSDTLTFSGMLPTSQSLRVTLRAFDPFGAFAIDTFTLNVIDDNNYPPLVLNPLPDAVATVGELFFFRLPENTFTDINDNILTISVNQSGGKPLPKWLQWDPKTSSLSGKPGPWDTGVYQDNKIDMEVWASDGVGSVKTSFVIIVQGESFWETFIKYSISFGSVAATGIGFFKSRALLWNYFNKSKCYKGIARGVAEEPFSRKIGLDFKQVKEIRTHYRGKLLAKLPDGLVYEENQIKGIPTKSSVGRFKVSVFNQDGYLSEEFDLIIKDNIDDSDPVDDSDQTFISLWRRSDDKRRFKSSIAMERLLPLDDA